MTEPGKAARRGWLLLAAMVALAGVFLRTWQLRRQLLIDDEWHAVHKLVASGYADIATHFGLADYCIPLTLVYRALFDAGVLTEWTMRLLPWLAGVALMAVGFRLLRDVADGPTRSIWLGLVALSPLLVYLSRTARPYTLAALAVFIAMVAFTRWWRTRSTGTAAAYIVATVLAGWLHLMTLPFTLAPLLLFGVASLADCRLPEKRTAALRTLAGLVLIGCGVLAALSALLLPALVTDWAALSQKAGGGAVTPHSAWRTWLMLAGTGNGWVGAIVGALAAVGAWRLWRNDRAFTATLAFSMLLGTAAIIASQPAWIQHPGVLARYVMPMLPFVFLFAAAGLACLLERLRPAALRIGIAAIVLAAWFSSGPLPGTLHYPSQFMGHPRYIFDYDPAHNPYHDPALVPYNQPVSPFYRSLAERPPGSVTLIEAPWRLESNYIPHDQLQQVHHQFVKAGMVAGVCGSSAWGDTSAVADRLKFRLHVPLAALFDGATWGADYLVIRPRPALGTQAEAPEWPDMSACLPRIEQRFGAPVYRDDEIIVFALQR